MSLVTLDRLDELALIDLTLTYITELEAISAVIAEEVRRIFLALPSLDRGFIEQFVRESKPWVSAGRAEAADLAAGYLNEVTGLVGRFAPVKLPEPEWSGPFQRTWHILKEGNPWEQARSSGATQAEFLGHDAVRDGANGRMRQANPKVVTAFRRVVNVTACEWCQVVSTQLYETAESATFGHRKCRCSVVAVIGANDPGVAINKQRLNALRATGAVNRSAEARERNRERQKAARRA